MTVELTAARMQRWLENKPATKIFGVDRAEIEFLRRRLLKLERLERAALKDTDTPPEAVEGQSDVSASEKPSDAR